MTAKGAMLVRGMSSDDDRDQENAFFWFSHPGRIGKLIAHYELYREIIGLPGDVFELGVYKAASLIRWASFRRILENDFSRKIVGFDAFGVFPREQVEGESDLAFIDTFETLGGDGLSRLETEEILDRKGFQNIALEQGNVLETIPAYLERYPASRLSLLHLDMDVAEPTDFAIRALYDRVVPGGLIIIDDYNAVAGASDVIDAFVAERGLSLLKRPQYSAPSFIRKPGGLRAEDR